ncbi:hypothetical protein M419DRAFT_127905 [Trichoderma reesei RUT C-30]|uniref:CCHC-type domain-containing protein n=1 Tax=Hypocrea jecorina (strain ATCC 56765 / BCRC 32924 / NRRL 11460 / Rut C-30) TaxID=1344414 RepID=A0A024SJ83_HYPJR|nr:hypothetical protein M419DRAFT_127905 [Trichoderma reesei RUT C-30]
MAESSNGQTRPADDSPCYNCGNRGHWTVACPEPIRQTPAGLANAWRNAPAAGHAGQGNNRHHGNQKRPNRGPIITKYAPPPPPPPPPPQPSLGHGAASYPPLAGPSYQQPGPQFPNPYPHYQPGPHYPTGYGPPQYPSAQYAQPPYGTAPPPVPVGYPPHPQGPSAPGAPPGAPPASYPPPYASYPPPGPSSTPSYPPPAAYAPPYPQQPYAPAPVPYPVHSGPAHYHPSSKPPHAAQPSHPPPKPPHAAQPHRPPSKPAHAAQTHHSPAAPSQALVHSLPPKPPRSIHAQQDGHLDNRNKRKHDRHGKHRDRRRDQGSRHRSSNQKTQNKANRSNRSNRSNPSGSAARSSQKQLALVNTESTKGGTPLPTNGPEQNARAESQSSNPGFQQVPPESNDMEESRHQDDQSNDGRPDDESHTADEVCRQSSQRDEAGDRGKPPQDDEASSIGDGEQHVHRPQVHEDAASTPGSITPAVSQLNGKHKRRDDESEDERRLKKSRSTSSFTNGTGAAVGNRTEAQSTTELEARDGEEQAVQDDDVTLPPLDRPSRSRSKERHQRPKSRNSSVSSRSSDLNSLEAELLGRPARQRSPADSGVHQRQDRFALPKTQRRRQQNVDSAYSRRW